MWICVFKYIVMTVRIGVLLDILKGPHVVHWFSQRYFTTLCNVLHYNYQSQYINIVIIFCLFSAGEGNFSTLQLKVFFDILISLSHPVLSWVGTELTVF